MQCPKVDLTERPPVPPVFRSALFRLMTGDPSIYNVIEPDILHRRRQLTLGITRAPFNYNERDADARVRCRAVVSPRRRHSSLILKTLSNSSASIRCFTTS